MMYREARAKTERAVGVIGSVSLAAAVVACLGFVGDACAQDWADYNAITPEQSDQLNATDYDAESLRVNVWLDRGADEVYQRGDRMDIRFETNADAYAVVYRIDTEGLVTVLWPRGRLDDGFVFGHHEYRLPISGDETLRTSSAEGVGYVEAIISRYPFDLRELELDFHHERNAEQLGFYIAGDPYLAMNEVNYVVTGLEDASGYAVTNHVSYYVHRQVDHPRYLCNQCHTDGELGYDPYRDTCSVEIYHDYGWQNDWYTTYGYYPVYYQPVYVYVDPWSYQPWVNYWYYPWYSWPGTRVNFWFGGCYDWCYSPYYGGDVYAYGGGSRYVPLSKNAGERTKVADRSRGGNAQTKGQRPGDDVVTAMKSRDRLGGARGVPRETSYRDVSQVARMRTEFERTVKRSRPGLQIRGRDPASGPRHEAMGSSDHAIRIRGGQRSDQRTRDGKYSKPTVRTGSRSNELRQTPNTRQTNRRNIKPVQPRNKGTRVWSGRRQAPNRDRNSVRQGSPKSSSRSNGTSTVKPRSGGGGQSSGSSPRTSTVKPSSPRTSQPATPSRPPAKRSGGGSRSGGGRSRSTPVRR